MSTRQKARAFTLMDYVGNVMEVWACAKIATYTPPIDDPLNSRNGPRYG